jgi:hypothetical protein
VQAEAYFLACCVMAVRPNVDQEAVTGDARDEDESSDTSGTFGDVESSDDEAALSEPSVGEQEADQCLTVGGG